MSRFPKGPRAVISGAGSGLGRELALQLADRKARVLALDINEASAEETVRLVKARGGDGFALRCDVGELADWQRAATEMQARFSGVDILINNAGVAGAGQIGAMPIEDWRWLMRVNLEGTIHGCHVFAPILRAQKSGFVLNVASMAGIASLPMMGAYNASKAAVIALSETLLFEGEADGVSVTVICPTFFPTNLMQAFRGGPKERAIAEQLFARSTATVADVARDAIHGLEAGAPLVITQADGRLVWRMKRLVPALYRRFVREGFARKLR